MVKLRRLQLLAPESLGKGVKRSSPCSCRDARRYLREQLDPGYFLSWTCKTSLASSSP